LNQPNPTQPNPTQPNLSLSDLPRWQGGFPGEHEYSTLEQLEGHDGRFDEALIAANALQSRWNGNKFVGLWLYGKPGTGKTHYAVGLGRVLHEAGADIAYLSIPNLISQHRQFGGVSKTEAEAAQYPSYYSSDPLLSNNLRSPRAVFNMDKPVQKPVLIMDDYRPQARRQVAAAIEAGTEAGGLVVVTSNYPDPFKLFDVKTGVRSEQEIVMRDMAQRADEAAVSALDESRVSDEQEFADSLRSRIAAGFKFLEFTGDDQRIARSFWG